MDTDKGLTRQLPPPEDNAEEQEVEIKQRNILELELDADDRLTCGGEPVTYDELTQRVEEFVANRADDPAMPEKSEREVHLLGRLKVSDRHVISIKTDRNTTYNAYFEMQNAIVRGYYHLRTELAQSRFGHGYDRCSQEERDAIALVYPQRISEAMPQDEGDGTTEEGGTE